MPQQMIWFFMSIVFSLIAWGIATARYIWPKVRLRQRAEALRPLLILHSFRFIGLAVMAPGVVSQFIARLRAFRGLWRRHCYDPRTSCAAIATHWGWCCLCADIQCMGLSRSPPLFLPRPSCRTAGGTVGSRILHSDSGSAAATDHAWTNFPGSSET
jgi:hypothetical protein